MGVAERRMERVFKGAANHRRLEVMRLLRKSPELSLTEIAERVGVDFRVASEHVRRLTLAGLVLKRNRGREVCHRLSARGLQLLTFAENLI